MSTATAQPMTLLRFDFAELYERHLCRHSQFGNNVAHLLALIGMWFGVYALALYFTQNPWVLLVLAGAYLGLVALNAPMRVILATTVFLAAFLAAVLLIPPIPVWICILMIPIFYEIQVYSHKVFTAEKDMTEFNKKYPKGPVLFVILLIFEVPLVLNYLVFDRKSWVA
jgi:hypothetical protein